MRDRTQFFPVSTSKLLCFQERKKHARVSMQMAKTPSIILVSSGLYLTTRASRWGGRKTMTPPNRPPSPAGAFIFRAGAHWAPD